MTGGEVAAAAKVAEAVGKKALGQDEKTKDVLLRVAEDTPEMKAAARNMAARTAVKERVKLLLYWPFARMIGVSQAYFEDTFPEEIGAKIADIPEENQITPPASIAVPVLHGLSYTFEEASLKDMFLNLLATASDARKADQAHPAFAEIIKQLSSSEASLLTKILEAGNQLAIVRLVDRLKIPPGSYIILRSNLIGLTDGTGEVVEAPQVPTWIDNWVRLGLVTVTYSESSSDQSVYDWVKSHPEYKRLLNADEVKDLDSAKGLLRVTDFGKQFIRAVH